MVYFGILFGLITSISSDTFICFGNLVTRFLFLLSITFFGFIIKPCLGICTMSVKPLCLALNRLLCKIVTPFIPSEAVISSKVVGKSRYFISVHCKQLFEKWRYI